MFLKPGRARGRIAVAILVALVATACSGSEPRGSQTETSEHPAPVDTTAPGSTTTTAADRPVAPEQAETDPEPTETAPEPDPAILEVASAGSLTIDGVTTRLVDSGLQTADVGDGEIHVIAGTTEDGAFLLVPIDASTWALSGEDFIIALTSGDQLTGPSAQLQATATSIEFVGDVTGLDGSRSTAAFVIEFTAGSSVFELDGNRAILTGTLGANTNRQVRYLIANHPEVDTLVLRLVPGSVDDTINVETGRLVREAGWTTLVPSDGEIYSGGVDLFAAGTRRIFEPGAVIGVHSWCCDASGLTADELAVDDPAHDSLIVYLTEMLGDQVGRDFYFFTIQAAPFDGVHEMTVAEITEYLATEPG